MLIEANDPVNLFISLHPSSHAERRPENGGRKVLGKRGIVRLLIEGGGEVVGSAVAQKVVNEVYFFVAPMIIGGKRSIASVGGPEIASLKNAVKIKNFKASFAGKDLLIRGTL